MLILSRCMRTIKIQTCPRYPHQTSLWTVSLETTSVPSATRTCPVRRSSPAICEVTTRSNHPPTLRTPQVRPRCTTAVSVARCCHPSPLWTVICWSTLVRDLSHAPSADKPSPPMGTCTDTRELMASRLHVMGRARPKFPIVASFKDVSDL